MSKVTLPRLPDPTRDLPATGFVRLPTILAVYPIGRSSWWKGVREGRFPRGVKLGPRTTAWRVEDVRRLIESTRLEEANE